MQIDLGELKPLRDKIAASIRNAIVEGKFKPGERLMEPDVANALGVSRTPLREAFLQLESEGFLNVIPRKGAVVSDLSLKDAEETYTIKGTLEALAAKLAVDKISSDTLNELITLNEKMSKIASSEEKDYKCFLELNAKFHQIIYETSGNEKLYKTINLLRNQTLRYNFIYLSLLSHLNESVAEHAEIIEAFKNKDAVKVEILIRAHAESARKALREYIEKKTLE
jgi:DNA-binding GntR family transcriptional regulator